MFSIIMVVGFFFLKELSRELLKRNDNKSKFLNEVVYKYVCNCKFY